MSSWQIALTSYIVFALVIVPLILWTCRKRGNRI